MRAEFGQRTHDNRCLEQIVERDFAPALALLLDEWLESNFTTFTIVDGDGGENGGAPPRDRNHLYLTLASRAAIAGAGACIRLLHERGQFVEWNQLLSARFRDVWTTPPARMSPLRRYDAFQYLLPLFILGSGVRDEGPSRLPPEAVEQSLALLAAHAPNPTRPLQTRLDAARAAHASWDTRTQLETSLALLLVDDDMQPISCAASAGLHRAVTALAGFGSLLTRRSLHQASTAAAVEALLNTLPDAEASRGSGGVFGFFKKLFTRFAKGSRSQSAGACASRQQTAAYILRSWHLMPHNAGAACALLASAASDPSADVMAGLLRDACKLRAPGEALGLARAMVTAAEVSEAGAAALGTVMAGVTPAFLSALVSSGQVLFAQLCADKGADVFVTSNGMSALFFNRYSCGRASPVLATAPPPAADPAVAAAMACGVFASAGAAHAHAAAAAAEEERLLAAVLADPDALLQRGATADSAWSDWAHSATTAVGARWLWQRMCESDPARAHEYLQPTDSWRRAPLLAAIEVRDVRCIRFFTSLGARMTVTQAGYLAEACLEGYEELSWALLAALPDDTIERASALRAKTFNSRYTALEAVAVAVLRGHRFSQPLAEALIAAGAKVPSVLLWTLCDKDTYACPRSSLPGELPRLLRWLFERQLLGCQASSA
jgi:hypothetical protein